MSDEILFLRDAAKSNCTQFSHSAECAVKMTHLFSQINTIASETPVVEDHNNSWRRTSRCVEALMWLCLAPKTLNSIYTLPKIEGQCDIETLWQRRCNTILFVPSGAALFHQRNDRALRHYRHAPQSENTLRSDSGWQKRTIGPR